MRRVGPYLIDRKLGTGGMGTVYLGRRESDGEPAAVKVLPASLAREPGFLARFEREVAALRQLDHPNVVRIFDSGAVDSETGAAIDAGEDEVADGAAYFYAMEYVEGETLLAKLRRDRKLPWRTVVDYAVQICAALKAAHDAGIVHRDIKPSNLLVSDGGIVKLADFGVAQVFSAGRLTKTGGVIGTAEFMSPEQAGGARATKRSDLYSLGAVMYVMLTGKPPFSGPTMLDVLHKHRYGRFERLLHYAPDCPSWLDDLVCQLLEKEPDKRPADAYVTGKRLKEIPKKVELSGSEPLPGSRVGRAAEQVVFSSEDAGEGSEASAGLDAPTRTAPGLTANDAPAPRGPGEATIMHALVREELERQQAGGPVSRFFDNTWVLVGLLLLLIAGGIVWYESRPSLEDHYEAARKTIETTPPGPDWLAVRAEHLAPLVAAGGEWQTKAEPLLDKIDAYDRARPKKGLAARRTAVASAGEAGSEAGRLLRLARSYEALGDDARAADLLTALVVVTEGRPEDAAVRAEAAAALAALRKKHAQRQEEFVRAARDRAAALRREGRPEDADAVLHALRTLYPPAVSEPSD